MKLGIVLLGALSLVACSKNRPAETTGAENRGDSGVAPIAVVEIDEIRSALLRDHPERADVVRSVAIIDDDGIVTLRGVVPDEQLKQDFTNRTRQVRGVRDVRNEMQAKAPAPKVDEVRMVLLQARPDAPDVVNALVITDEDGVVTLHGKVDDEQMHQDLLKRAKAMPNVKEVRDELQVSGKGPATSTANAVRSAMLRDRPAAAETIHALVITNDDNVIVLTGTVPDESTRSALVDSAKRTPGVKSVRDQLKVSPQKGHGQPQEKGQPQKGQPPQ